MRKFILSSLGILAVGAMVVAASATVDAQRGPRGRANGVGGPPPAADDASPQAGRGGRAGGPVGIAGRLDLTDEQRTAIGAIMQDSRDTVAPLADQLRLARQNLRRAVFADEQDPQAIETIAAQVSTLEAQIADARLQAEVAVAGQLTEDQKAKVRTTPGAFGARAGRGPGARRGGPGGSGPRVRG